MIYEVNEMVAKEAAMLRIQLRKKGKQLDAIDSMIATIALWNDLTLLTTDKDFQRVPTLQTANWLRG
ncbi:MAG: type II toxin-antitoxin system VapC family toxin [Chloroflexota bacterium]